jgi:hypothetical protein
MSLATIENLFVIRSNLLAMGDLRSIWRTPLLFFMALLVWSLGIVTIYPPGALIVTFEAHAYTENHNVSVMNPPVPRELDLITGTSPSLALGGDALGRYFDNVHGTYDGYRIQARGFRYEYVIPSSLYSLRNSNRAGLIQ